LRDDVPDDLVQQLLLARDVVVDRGSIAVERFGDIVEARVRVAVLLEELRRSLDDFSSPSGIGLGILLQCSGAAPPNVAHRLPPVLVTCMS
jgi:hypothetical protein